MKRKNVLIVSGSLVILSGIYIGYRAIKRKQTYENLVTKIKAQAVTGQNQQVVKALGGNYHKELQTDRPFVKLKENSVKQRAERLRNAFSGMGTDEEAIFGVINGLNDKVALSQIASYYTNRYNEDFKTRMNSELDTAERAEVFKIMSLKPDVRWLA